MAWRASGAEGRARSPHSGRPATNCNIRPCLRADASCRWQCLPGCQKEKLSQPVNRLQRAWQSSALRSTVTVAPSMSKGS